MFTTLLRDDTDTFFDSGLATLKRLPPRFSSFHTEINENDRYRKIERFTNNLTIPAVTLGNADTTGTLVFQPGTSGAFYTIENQNGVLTLLQSDTATSTQNKFMSLASSGDFTIMPLMQSNDANDTSDLIPVTVDSTGKIQRGYNLYQSINANLSQLNSRVEVLEQTTSPVLSTQISSRLSDIETLGQKIRLRINGLNMFSPPL